MPPLKCLIDTDVLVEFLRGNPKAIKFLESTLHSSYCYISTITIAELYAGVREGKERTILDQFIGDFQLALLHRGIAQKGGIYKRDYGKSHGTGLADALIAATAEDLKARLITFNKKHFPMLKDLEVPYKRS